MKDLVSFKLKGPNKIIKKRKEIHDLKTVEIVSVDIFTKSNNKTINCVQNKIDFTIKEDCTIYIYHSFDNLDYSGRWYDVDFPKQKLYDLEKNSSLVVEYKNWEDYDTNKLTTAIITIKLSDKAVSKILNALKKCKK